MKLTLTGMDWTLVIETENGFHVVEVNETPFKTVTHTTRDHLPMVVEFDPTFPTSVTKKGYYVGVFS